jgi:excinuclease ABC subunit B
MVKSLWETYRRRKIQKTHNIKHHISPRKATSNAKDLESVKTDEDLSQSFNLMTRGKTKRLRKMTKMEKSMIAKDLKAQLDLAIKDWKFEEAAVIRDQLKELDES